MVMTLEDERYLISCYKDVEDSLSCIYKFLYYMDEPIMDKPSVGQALHYLSFICFVVRAAIYNLNFIGPQQPKENKQ